MNPPIAFQLLGLHPIDAIVIAVYLLGVTSVGFFVARHVKDLGGFVMPRWFGKSFMLMHSFGTGTHSDQAVGVASKTYSAGLSGIWYQWLWLFSTPFYWIIAPIMRRFRAYTTADVFEARFDRSVAGLFAGVCLIHQSYTMGLILLGSGKIIEATTGSAVRADVAIYMMTVLFMVYGIAGGLAAAIITDFVQGILTVIFSFILLPFILHAVGGIEGMHNSPALDDQMLSLVAPGEIGVFYIVMISLNALVSIVAIPVTMSACGAGRTELDGQIGFTFGTFLKRICTVAWCMTGLAAVVYFAGQAGREEIDPDQIYGLVANDFLPRIAPGLLGLFLASLLAAVMSSCDSMMIAISALFTSNVYRPMVPNRSKGHYVWVARVAAAVVVTGGVVFALTMENVQVGMEVLWKLLAMMGIAFWLGLCWRRTTVVGAWAATLGAFAAWGLTNWPAFIQAVAETPYTQFLQLTWGEGDDLQIYLPWQMLFYLTSGLAAGVFASLVTWPVAEEKLERFYALIRTPVTPGEQVDQPCTLPPATEVPPKRLLLPGTGLEILRPGVRSIGGFLFACALVVGIIVFVAVYVAK